MLQGVPALLGMTAILRCVSALWHSWISPGLYTFIKVSVLLSKHLMMTMICWKTDPTTQNSLDHHVHCLGPNCLSTSPTVAQCKQSHVVCILVPPPTGTGAAAYLPLPAKGLMTQLTSLLLWQGRRCLLYRPRQMHSSDLVLFHTHCLIGLSGAKQTYLLTYRPYRSGSPTKIYRIL